MLGIYVLHSYCASQGDVIPRTPQYRDPCRENLDACTTLPECWYFCGDVIKPLGMGANVPPEPLGYSTFNSVSGRLGTIAGGERNYLSGLLGTISGGKDNTGSGNLSSVGGGKNNKAGGRESVISGGKNNMATGDGSVVPGGTCNTAGHKNSMAFGGLDSDTGDCISDGAKACNTDEDGQVKFCNPTNVFDGSVAVGNISISNDTIKVSEIETVGIKLFPRELKNEDDMTHTEITHEKMRTPMIETKIIRMRPDDNGRRLESTQVFTVVDLFSITTNTIMVTDLFVDGIRITPVANTWLIVISLIMNITLWVFVLYNKYRVVRVISKTNLNA